MSISLSLFGLHGARTWRVLRFAAVATLLSSAAAGQTTIAADLTEMSLEDLLSIEVTSVARREQTVSQSASAVYVITREDIRRSGATSIPDALRLAPGVQVMRTDGTKWAVSIRGFVGRFANRVLVMIDGRSVYTATSGGVYWEANEVPLELIERIEVIRGPGATMWGANAVNGVINVITRHGRDTHGVQVTAGGGNHEGAFGSVRFGAEAGPTLHYRAYSTYDSSSGLSLASGERANDNVLKSQGGFRIDWEPSGRNQFLFSGDAYNGDGGERLFRAVRHAPYSELNAARAKFSGGNLFGRWTHKVSERSVTELQVYFDRVVRNNLLETEFGISLGDAELQHQINLSRHKIVLGVGYRVSTDKTHFVPRSRTLQRGSAFLQDEIAIVPGKLLLTVGSKLEKNTFSAWELQPSTSLLWNRGDRDTAWVAVSRAAQVPYRSAHDVLNDIFSRPGPQGSVIVGRVFGSADIVADYESALDAGYRIRASRRLSFDLAGFYNHYSGPISKLARAPEFLGGDPPVTLIPLVFTNIPPVETYGAELAASWSPMDAGSLRVSYSWITGETAPDPTIQEPAPRHQLHGRWYWNLPGGLQWDSSYWFIDGHSTIRSYHRVDTRLGWRPNRRWEFSVGGQHLLDNQHLEIPGLLAFPNEVPRSVYGKVTITPF